MKTKLIVILTCVFLCSCSDDKPKVIKTKSGLYGSSEGQFLIKFPKKPDVVVESNKIGEYEFETISYKCELGIEEHFIATYADYPQVLLQSWDIEQLFDQNMKTIDITLEFFSLRNRIIDTTEDYEKSITYQLYPSQPGQSGVAYVRLLKSGGRIYQISYLGFRKMPPSEKILEFLDSFRIYKS